MRYLRNAVGILAISLLAVAYVICFLGGKAEEWVYWKLSGEFDVRT